MAEPLDNDLLTLWLRAGDLTRDEVRALIDDNQRLRRLAREAYGEALTLLRNSTEEWSPAFAQHENRLIDAKEAVAP